MEGRCRDRSRAPTSRVPANPNGRRTRIGLQRRSEPRCPLRRQGVRHAHIHPRLVALLAEDARFTMPPEPLAPRPRSHCGPLARSLQPPRRSRLPPHPDGRERAARLRLLPGTRLRGIISLELLGDFDAMNIDPPPRLDRDHGADRQPDDRAGAGRAGGRARRRARFWLPLLGGFVIASPFAFAVNRAMIRRGEGHAVVHEYHH
jgi:hypothetical protein